MLNHISRAQNGKADSVHWQPPFSITQLAELSLPLAVPGQIGIPRSMVQKRPIKTRQPGWELTPIRLVDNDQFSPPDRWHVVVTSRLSRAEISNRPTFAKHQKQNVATSPQPYDSNVRGISGCFGGVLQMLGARQLTKKWTRGWKLCHSRLSSILVGYSTAGEGWSLSFLAPSHSWRAPVVAPTRHTILNSDVDLGKCI
jgi:hypothetical protein